MGCYPILPSYALHMLLVPNRRVTVQQEVPSQAGSDRADVRHPVQLVVRMDYRTGSIVRCRPDKSSCAGASSRRETKSWAALKGTGLLK